MELFAEVLELCRKPAAKTRIMYKTGVSYPTSQSLIEQLLKLEMLKACVGTKKFETTEKGAGFLKKYSALQKLLET